MSTAACAEPPAGNRRRAGGACVVLHVATPTNAALQEMNFVLSDLALEVVGDAAIVWLLSPKAAIGPRPAGGLSRLTSSLPGYFLQVGARRLTNLCCACMCRWL
jgi:Protein RETICULATA-related